MSNIFSETEVLKLPRSFQELNFNLETTLGYGKLYPVFWQDCVPGDSVNVQVIANIKVKPMVNPNLTPNKMTVHFFFVPYRLLDENFTKGVMGVNEQGEKFAYNFPKWTIDATATKLKTLWDYFGLPINVKENLSGTLEEDTTNVYGIEPTKYLVRAYNKVYNDMYRPENFEEEVDLDNTTIKYRCWRADYYTKALPFQQKPEDELFSLPVNTTIDFSEPANFTPFKVTLPDDLAQRKDFSTKEIRFGSFNEYYRKHNDASNTINGADGVSDAISAGQIVDAAMQTSNSKILTVKLNGNEIAQNLTATSTSFDISDLRLASQLQKWAERNARGGTRYDEYIRAHFGVTPKDARLQLPEFLGGFKIPILCGESYQTSETGTTPQGHRVGIGNGYGGDRIRSYFCEEYGIILGIASVLPQAKYQQGLNRQWLKHDSLDWYHHEFCCLSEREIYQGELVCSNSEDNQIAEKYNKTIFGYTGIYNEYRFYPNIITGEMRTGYLARWNQSRIMDAGYTTDEDSKIIPNTKLSKSFVQAQNVNMSPYLIQEGEDPFILTFGYKVKAFRPMTYKAEPGLLDHF